MGIRGTRAGAVTFVQRFGSALNLNVHFHCVVPDGVWVREEGGVQFVPLPGLTDDDVAQVLRSLERCIRALLKPRLDALREDARPPDALARWPNARWAGILLSREANYASLLWIRGSAIRMQSRA